MTTDYNGRAIYIDESTSSMLTQDIEVINSGAETEDIGNPYHHGVLGLVTGNNSTDQIVFDFINWKIQVPQLYLQNRIGEWIGPTVVAINSSSRNLYWNSVSKSFRLFGSSASISEITKNDHLIAVFRADSGVSWSACPNFRVVSTNDTTAVPRLNAQKQCVILSFDSAFNVDFEAERFSIHYENVWMYRGTERDISLAGYSVSINNETRMIYYDASTYRLVTTNSRDSALDYKNLWLIAVIFPPLNMVAWSAATKYSINGQMFNHQDAPKLAEQAISEVAAVASTTNAVMAATIGVITGKNLIDYVRGQEAVAEKWSLPVCDLYRKSGLNYANKDMFIQADQLHYKSTGYAHIATMTAEFIRQNAPAGGAKGKTIGVLGGSYSVMWESQAAKDVWVSELGVTYTDYGVSGAGFTKEGNYIDDQADAAAYHDIYILWCSTNDATSAKPIGNVNDYDHSTQCGGMNLAIQKLFYKNPSAKILIFNSMKAYSSKYLYDPTIIREY